MTTRVARKHYIKEISSYLDYAQLCSIAGFRCLLLNTHMVRNSYSVAVKCTSGRHKSIGYTFEKLWSLINRTHFDFVIFYDDDADVGRDQPLILQTFNAEEAYSSIANGVSGDVFTRFEIHPMTAYIDTIRLAKYIMPFADDVWQDPARCVFKLPISSEEYSMKLFDVSSYPPIEYGTKNIERFDEKPEYKRGLFNSLYLPTASGSSVPLSYRYSNMYIWWRLNALIRKYSQSSRPSKQCDFFIPNIRKHSGVRLNQGISSTNDLNLMSYMRSNLDRLQAAVKANAYAPETFNQSIIYFQDYSEKI